MILYQYCSAKPSILRPACNTSTLEFIWFFYCLLTDFIWRLDKIGKD
jgi:hypothetical protein